MTPEVEEHARKVAKCIYIAADKVVADDVSSTIGALLSVLSAQREAIEDLSKCNTLLSNAALDATDEALCPA